VRFGFRIGCCTGSGKVLFAWVGIDSVLWGLMSRYLNSVASTGYNFTPALLGAVLLRDFSIRIMQGVTIAFFEDVWPRNYLDISAPRLSFSEYDLWRNNEISTGLDR